MPKERSGIFWLKLCCHRLKCGGSFSEVNEFRAAGLYFCVKVLLLIGMHDDPNLTDGEHFRTLFEQVNDKFNEACNKGERFDWSTSLVKHARRWALYRNMYYELRKAYTNLGVRVLNNVIELEFNANTFSALRQSFQLTTEVSDRVILV